MKHLSADQASEMRRRYLVGETRAELAEAFGVSVSAVIAVLTYKSHVSAGGPHARERERKHFPTAERNRVLEALKAGPLSSVEVGRVTGIGTDRAQHLLREMRRYYGSVDRVGWSSGARWFISGAAPAPAAPIKRRALRVVPDGGWYLVPGDNEARRDDCERMRACVDAWCRNGESGSAACMPNCTGYQPVSRDQRIAEAVDGRGRSMVGGEW